jgi:hypothetical protein
VEGFLPPQAPGPEPELGQRPQAPPPAPEATAPVAYAPQAAVEPDNGPAVTGFVLSLVAGGLLIVSGGISTILSLGLAIAGIVQSNRGKRKVRSGETTRNAGLAQAGFIIGIVSLVLSSLATVAWIFIAILLATDDEFRDDFENEFENSNTVTALRIVGIAGRALLT